MDRFDEWNAYVAVAGARSFTRAARSLGRSPQAITRAVASLEGRLGYRLLHRTTRSVSLTSEGRAALERGRRLLEDLRALEAAEDAALPLTGTLTVTAPVLFGQLHVVPVVTEMLSLHPQLDVRLLLVDRVVSLSDEGVDVAVRIGALPDSSLRARVVGEVRQVCVASAAYLKAAAAPLRSPDDLARHACIAFTGVTPVPDRWTFGARAVRVRPRLVVNTGDAALAAAAAGAGITRVLSYQARGLLRTVLEDHEPPAVPVQLVTLPGVPARAAPAFVDLATSRLRAALK
jgi:DNA-binding transcriptional LysR family regulator